jgi:hypothetical protein
MGVMFESEYVRLVDFGNYYVLEDKTRLGLPKLGRKAFDAEGEYIFADVVETPDGNVGVERWYIPKDLRNPTDKKDWVLQKAKALSYNYEKGRR